MPLRNLGGGCWIFGEEGKGGKKYCGAGARAKAAAQGRAIEWSKHSQGAMHIIEDIFKAQELLDQGNVESVIFNDILDSEAKEWLKKNKLSEIIENSEATQSNLELDEYEIVRYNGGITFLYANTEAADSTQIQTLIFDKKKFSKEQATEWAKKHNFKTGVDEKAGTYHLRQKNPGDFKTIRTIKLAPGISATVGK